MIFGIRFKNTTECRVVFLLNEKNFCHVHDKKSLLERMVNLRNIVETGQLLNRKLLT